MQQLITFNGKQESDLQKSSSFFLEWDELMPHIEKAILMRPDEMIDGFEITDTGMRVKIGRKKGRKSNKNSST